MLKNPVLQKKKNDIIGRNVAPSTVRTVNCLELIIHRMPD